MIRFLVLLLCCNFISCNNTKNSDKTASVSDVIIGENIKFSIEFITDKNNLNLEKIKIYNDNGLIQSIITEKIHWINDYDFKDWNFDGFHDIEVKEECGATGLCTYWVWNFDPEAERFVLNEDVSGYMGWQLDSISKQLINHYSEGANHEFWRYYKYVADSLQLVKYVDHQILLYDNEYWKVISTSIFDNNNIIKSKDSVLVNTFNK